jgi:type I restriction enzyme S subunit
MEVAEQKKVRVPKLRFREFDEEKSGDSLKKYFFEDVFVFSMGKNIKQNEASPEFEIPCVRYGELYHMYNEVITEVINRTNLVKSELKFSFGDEILLPSAGEDPLDIGSASALTLKDIAIGRTINVLRPRSANIYDQRFAAYYINQKSRKQIAALAKGVSISNVYNSDLKGLEIILPSLPEQQKIASFLSAVDERLGHLARKKQLLEQYKKGVMQQLFSQQLRFKREDGSDYEDWVEKMLGEVLTIGSGKDYKHLEKGEIPVFGTGGLMLHVNDYLYSGETVFIGRKGTIDKPFYFNGPFWTVDTLFYTHKFIKTAPKFIYAVFQTINWQLYNEASGVPSLSKKTIEEIPVRIPSLEEQQKIADFLSSLDKKIDAVGTQIQLTQQFKKGLLQEMFV